MKIIEGGVCAAKGFKAGAMRCGIRKSHTKKDLAMILSDCVCNASAVYTTNRVKASPILLTKEHLADGKAQAVIVNSGNANACAPFGMENARRQAKAGARALGVSEENVIVASTGVIGQTLPVEAIEAHAGEMEMKYDNSLVAAEAIMTTDTKVKTIAVEFDVDGTTCHIGGICKGSGMIHPNMATMLGFITCDANISSDTLQLALSQNVEKTFNQITVDGDTSTNDMVLVMSNGCTLNEEILPDTPEFDKFSKMLNFVMQELAKKIAKDGEGANKLIQVDVVNAPNALDARMMAKSVVGSSLVKTAIFGEDPNWGRILAAVGYAGVDVPVDNVDIMLGGLAVMLASSPVTFDDEEMKDIMHEDEVTITVDLHAGHEKGTAWGCDLSYDYVKINALYHT